jgi:hypothetical protein
MGSSPSHERSSNVQRVRMHRRGGAFRKALIAVIAGLVLIVGATALLGGYGSTDGGHIAIVRNGGPLDNTKIRQIVTSGSGRTRIGLYSTMHKYPTSQRFFTISSSGNADANESVTVPDRGRGERGSGRHRLLHTQYELDRQLRSVEGLRQRLRDPAIQVHGLEHVEGSLGR